MDLFRSADFDGHEEIVFASEPQAGLTAIIAVHSTALGPACGGVRFYPYADESQAATDVLRLSRGMSYKNAMAGLPMGGGKAVIIGDPRAIRTDALMAAFGRAVDKLNGRYITAMDVGVTEADMEVIARETRYVAGYAQAGREGGDPSPMTAYGVFLGIKAAVRHVFGTDQLSGLTVGVQGLGKVGFDTARQLKAAGAALVVADVNPEAVRRAVDELGARAVGVDAILGEACDVLSPCALGAILNDATIPALKARIVAGGANNQLARDHHGAMLKAKGVLYAPDYVINGGGVIRVAAQWLCEGDAWARARAGTIAETLATIFALSDESGDTTNAVADFMARERIAAARPLARAA